MQPQSALLPHSGNQLQPAPLLDLTQNIPGGQAPSPHSLQPPLAQVARVTARGELARGTLEESLSPDASSPLDESSDSLESSLESVERVLPADDAPEPCPPQPMKPTPATRP
jgi:hypothetical protein